MGWLEFAAFALLCGTVVTCFGIRASHGQDVDALEDQLALLEGRHADLIKEHAATVARLEDAREVIAHNAVLLSRLAKDSTHGIVKQLTSRSGAKS